MRITKNRFKQLLAPMGLISVLIAVALAYHNCSKVNKLGSLHPSLPTQGKKHISQISPQEKIDQVIATYKNDQKLNCLEQIPFEDPSLSANPTMELNPEVVTLNGASTNIENQLDSIQFFKDRGTTINWKSNRLDQGFTEDKKDRNGYAYYIIKIQQDIANDTWSHLRSLGGEMKVIRATETDLSQTPNPTSIRSWDDGDQLAAADQGYVPFLMLTCYPDGNKNIYLIVY